MISTAAWDRFCCRKELLLCHDNQPPAVCFLGGMTASLSPILARSFVPQGTGFRVGTTHPRAASNRSRLVWTSVIAEGDSPRGHSCLRRRFVFIPPGAFPDVIPAA